MKTDSANERWLSTLRHDLRTPINHILGYSELFDEELEEQGVQNRGDLIELKADPVSRHLPVIMISALDEMERVIQCIEAGAEDYLPKPFDPTLLRARICASLEKKALRDLERAHLQKIEETQERLVGELKQASNYVASMLPKTEDDPLKIQWRFETSTELGGDAFGYHRLDENSYTIFLLDVCGHGVGPRCFLFRP